MRNALHRTVASQKFCCLYTEVQLPPSQDIGEHGQASAKQLNEFKDLEVLYMMDPIDVDAAKQLNEFKDLEVLYMMDPIDVDAAEQLNEFKGLEVLYMMDPSDV